jgi:hypothetical protein
MPDGSAEHLRQHSEKMPALEWPEPTQSPQRLDILVNGWSFRVGSTSLNGVDFAGQCVTSPLRGLEVDGEFKSFKSRSSLLES